MSFYQINPLKVDWESKSSAVFFNDRHAKKKIFRSYIKSLPYLSSHVWLATSGRSQEKWMALSKKALLISAEAVNKHLKASAKDRWGVLLPLFHVGGLSILARAHIAHSSYVSYKGKWSARGFKAFLEEHQITLSSLVPTQVYDIVKEKISPPPSLRAVVVGGGALNKALYSSARSLNWPLLPSYGLTECASQVATQEIEALSKEGSFAKMKILSHVQVRVVQQEIALKSESLFTGFVPLFPNQKGEFQDPKKKGWYFTGDKGRVKNNYLWIELSQIKILGEKVNMKALEEELMKILLKKSLSGHCFLLALPSEREGFQIALVSDTFKPCALSDIIQQFNKRVSPFEKIQQFYFVPELPWTGISKISKPTLLKNLGFPS